MKFVVKKEDLFDGIKIKIYNTVCKFTSCNKSYSTKEKCIDE